jgi:hypothetical protein
MLLATIAPYRSPEPLIVMSCEGAYTEKYAPLLPDSVHAVVDAPHAQMPRAVGSEPVLMIPPPLRSSLLST